MMNGAKPRDLEGWKQAFCNLIEDARCAVMTGDDRDALVAFLSTEIESIFFGPEPTREVHDFEPRADDPWRDLGYGRGLR